jgi:hypothetical protein
MGRRWYRIAALGGVLLLIGASTRVALAAEPTTVEVATAEQLAAAMADARPGQTIQLADGTYHGEAFTTVSGTPDRPITLKGSANAVIVNDFFVQPTTPCPSGHTAYGVWLNGASYWHLTGFTVANSKKGIVLDHATGVQISGVTIHDIAEEGVHFRSSTTDSSIVGSVLSRTGLVQQGFGEGVYIGSARGNWRCFGEDADGVTPKNPDRSDRIRVIGNRFGPDIAAEHIDIKEGTVDGEITGNVFDGRGLTGANTADSWIDVKGSRYRLIGNFGTYAQTPGSVFANGYEIHEQFGLGYGCGNVFTGNFSVLGGVGAYAVLVTDQDSCAARGEPNVVDATNVVSGATIGLPNIPVA